MTRRDIRDRIFKIVFTLEFNDAEGMQDQLDFAFDPEMPGDEEDDPLLYGIVSNEDRDYITTKVKNIISKKAEIRDHFTDIRRLEASSYRQGGAGYIKAWCL